MLEGPEAAAGVSVGEILADKYRVERVLGAGGMGVVVAARHVELDERVAIKFLLPHMLADPASVARFYREAKAAARIKSEHVARVFDVGRLPNGAPYMVMEFLEGSDLAGWISQHGPMPVPQAVDFIVQACVAVADAHTLGIVHRDLKPANLFCVRRSDGQLSVKVLDFGISKVSEPGGGGMSFTQTTAMMGSPLYMSPEQFRSSKNVDGRTDIWALGAILFELVTGQAPFFAESVTELAIKIATEPARSLHSIRQDLPASLATIVSKCLAKEPDGRYATVAELALALTPLAPPHARASITRIAGIMGKRDEQAPPPSLTPPSAANEARTAPGLQWTAPEAPRRRSLALPLTFVGAALLLGLTALGWWKGRTDVGVATPAGPSAAQATPPSAARPSEPALASAPPAVEAAAVTPAASAAAAIASVAPAPAPAPAVRTPAARPKAAAAAAKPRPPSAGGAVPAAPARVSCDPPFYFDSAGNRVFKQECL